MVQSGYRLIDEIISLSVLFKLERFNSGLRVFPSAPARPSACTISSAGYIRLLSEVRRGSFDIVIVEAVDRLARKLSDVANLHDELPFHGMSLYAVNVGAVTCMSACSAPWRRCVPPNISVNPNLASVYCKKVEELETLLDDAEHCDEAMELIRSLIDKIELTPCEERGLDAVLHGDLARIVVLCSTGTEEAKPLSRSRCDRI